MAFWDSWFGSPQPQGNPHPAQAKPPPPPTTPHASATQPTQECPLHAKHPCDVNKLMLSVEGWDSWLDEEKKFKLETTKVRRLEPVTDVKDQTALTLLKTYDLLIDCLAESDAAQRHKPKGATIEGRAYYTGRHCETESHALLRRLPLGTRDDLILKQVGAEELEAPEHKFYAMKSYIDSVEGRKEVFDNAATVFGIIKSFIESITGKVTEVDLIADACGKRARGDTAPLNQSLKARVRIFRRSRWSIGIKIPPLGSFKEERAQTLDVRGISTSSSSREATAGFNAYSNKTSSTSSGEGVTANYKHTQETQVGSKVDSYEASRTVRDGSVTQKYEEKHSKSDGRSFENEDGEITTEEIKKRLEREKGFDLVISIDNTEIEVGEGIKKIKEEINKIVEVITDIKKLFDKVPQVGWKFTFDVSVFAGTFAIECYPDYVPGPKANGRYYPVQHKFVGNIDIELFSISIAVSFGVDARALDSGLVLKIQGTISLDCSVETEITLDFWTPKKELEIEANAKAELAVVGYVSLAGHTLADAKLSASTGLGFKGVLEAELSTRKFDLKGKLKTKPIMLTGYIRGWLWDSKMNPKQLLPGRDLYTFG